MKFIAYYIAFSFLAAVADGTQIEASSANIPLSTTKVAHITGTIDATSSMIFSAEMEATAAIRGDRVIIISSDGGMLSSGQEMLDVIEKEKSAGVKIVCVVQKGAASMAFNILTHCDKRLAYPGAKFLFHKAAVGEFLPNMRRTARNLREVADDLEREDKPYSLANREALHMSEQEYDFYAAQDFFWMAPALIRMGYLDGYAEVKEQ